MRKHTVNIERIYNFNKIHHYLSQCMSAKIQHAKIYK